MSVAKGVVNMGVNGKLDRKTPGVLATRWTINYILSDDDEDPGDRNFYQAVALCELCDGEKCKEAFVSWAQEHPTDFIAELEAQRAR